MLSSARDWRSLLLCGLVGLWSGLAMGQVNAPLGPEYFIAEARRGDQVASHLCLGPDGGYLVWQDNGIDGKGAGIAARRLSAAFGPEDATFRVNQIVVGDQERPQVGLLTNGGAVFVWEGGRNGFHNIYTRFLGPNGRFLGGDIRVQAGSFSVTNVITTNWLAYRTNRLMMRKFTFKQIVSQARESFRDPAVTVLADGNVVVAYSGFRKVRTRTQQLVNKVTFRGNKEIINSVLQPVESYIDSMQDVMFRRYSPAGKRLGGEVVVNEFLPYNQRNPALTALKNGNFVVVWVSEQQVAETQAQKTVVDIRARVFNAAGQPLGSEFRVNAESGFCGTPSVSALGEDGFTVVWSQFDPLGGQSWDWDIYGRVFNSSGPSSPPLLLNTFQRGLQYAPRITTAGLNQLVLWTSMGQDGSFEGVYGRLLSAGLLAGPEFRVNTRTISKQFQPAIASDGAERFVSVWSSFVSLPSGFDLIAQQFLTTQPPPALPAPTVIPVDAQTLSVTWSEAPAQGLSHYELYMDGSDTPLTLEGNSWLATEFLPESTHEFRVGYVLSDGQRSPLSAPGLGTTLDKLDRLVEANNTPAEAPAPAEGWFGSGGAPLAGSDGVLRIGMSVTRLGRSLHWNTQPGGLYQVQSSTNLATWSNVGEPRASMGANDSLDVTNSQKAAFYRVIRLR